MVTVEVAVPLATTGPVPEMLEFAIAGRPAVKTTVLPDFKTGLVILKIFDSALVEARVQKETPSLPLMEQAS